MVNDELELMLKDGTWYQIQRKMEEIGQGLNGMKWIAFNCPRKEPRFAGVTQSGLAKQNATNIRAAA